MKDVVTLIHGEFFERGLPALTPREAQVPAARNKIIAVLGMRRAGKTYFLYQQIQQLLKAGEPKGAILYLNLEDDRFLTVDRTKLAQLIESFYTLYPENHQRRVFLFLDEIQNVEGWPSVLRRFLDTKNIRIFVTGSSTKLLSKEIATALRGRSLACEIAPFSVSERFRFLAIENLVPGQSLGPATRDRLLKQLRLHLRDGGFPETIDMPPSERIQNLQNYVDVVILRDIVERHGITNVTLVRYLIRTLISSAGCLFTVNKFFNDLKSQGLRVAKNTLHDYLEYVEDAFLAFLVPTHTTSLRKRQVNPRKVYVVDPGLVTAFSFRFEDLGARFENLVYNDLRRRGCEITYLVTRTGREVDFVARYPDGHVRLYQASYDISDPDTARRETEALADAGRELSLHGQLVTPANYFTEFLPELETAARRHA